MFFVNQLAGRVKSIKLPALHVNLQAGNEPKQLNDTNITPIVTS